MEKAHATLRSRFGAMDTVTLTQMWQEQSLEPWAEKILAEELRARDISEASLQQAILLRQAPPLPTPPSITDTFVFYGLLGTFGCATLAMAFHRMLTGTLGPVIASAAILATLIVYLIILIRRLLAHRSSTVGVGILLVLLWIHAGSLVLSALIGAAALTFG